MMPIWFRPIIAISYYPGLLNPQHIFLDSSSKGTHDLICTDGIFSRGPVLIRCKLDTAQTCWHERIGSEAMGGAELSDREHRV